MACGVYPSRLAGVSLSSSAVRYYSLNGAGEIDRMILEDVTGDMYRYGILTELTSTPAGEFSTYYTYEFQVDGVTGVIPPDHHPLPRGAGPRLSEGDGGAARPALGPSVRRNGGGQRQSVFPPAAEATPCRTAWRCTSTGTAPTTSPPWPGCRAGISPSPAGMTRRTPAGGRLRVLVAREG